ncbi:hypothetical protein DRQ50_14675 [bacterium]|nr:MAG: hypothetical protein DRQ50_14675 [bacterium]
MTVSTLPCTAELAFEEALDAMGGDGELLQEIVEIFLETGHEQLRQLETAAERGDMELLQNVAHSLKGSAASIGALGFAAVARDVECMARVGGRTHVQELLVHLREKYEELEAVCAEVDWDILPSLSY